MVFEYYEARKRLRRAYMIRGALAGAVFMAVFIALDRRKERVMRWLAGFEGSPWAPPPYYDSQAGFEQWIALIGRPTNQWFLIGFSVLVVGLCAWSGSRYATDPPPGRYRVHAYAQLALMPLFLLVAWVPTTSWAYLIVWNVAFVAVLAVERLVHHGKLPWLRAPVLRDRFPEDFPVTEDA